MWIRQGAYFLKGALNQAPVLLSYIRLCLKYFLWWTLPLLSRGQCYTTFYFCNLRIFVLNQSVCKNALEELGKDKHSSLLRKLVNYRQMLKIHKKIYYIGPFQQNWLKKVKKNPYSWNTNWREMFSTLNLLTKLICFD